MRWLAIGLCAGYLLAWYVNVCCHAYQATVDRLISKAAVHHYYPPDDEE